jgi:ferredoxin-NADP reductase
MTAANHPTPSTRWFETLAMPLKAAWRHTRADPLAPLRPANDALQSVHLSPLSQQTAKKSGVSTISHADGQLVLPATLPARMLLLSADAGITRTMSMLRELQARNYQGDVVLLHVCRSPAELHQASVLQRAADSYPELSLLVHFDDRAGQFGAEALSLAVPDVNERTTWICGPKGFVEMVQAYWRDHGLTPTLHSELCFTAVHVM